MAGFLRWLDTFTREGSSGGGPIWIKITFFHGRKNPGKRMKMQAQPDKVIFGGCGVFFGSIRRPAVPPAKRPRRTLWSILGFSQKSDRKE
jgi:hypothetical protein